MTFRLFALLCSLALIAVPAHAATVRATLSWADNSTDEDGFRVERNVDAGALTTVASLPVDSTSYVDEPLLLGTAYCYRIVAFNGLGDSAPSAQACGTTPALPASPGGLQLIITIVP